MCISVKYLLGPWHTKPDILKELKCELVQALTQRYEIKDIKHSQVCK